MAWPLIRNGDDNVIVDAGCGGGDTLRKILRTFSTRYPLRLIGVDMNPWAKRSALAAREEATISYETKNIFAFSSNEKIDIVIASLFTHHLTTTQILDFLRWADKSATRGWFINDLHRHPIPYYFIKYATRLFSHNRLIRNDAAVSVARSFTRDDWNQLLRQAGLDSKTKVEWYFPFRFCVSCIKDEAINHA